MNFSINYSTPAAELVESGQIQIDSFKRPDWGWMVDEALPLRPVAIHFNLEAGNGRLEKIDWDEVQSLSQATHTPFINLHLDPKQKHHPRLAVDSVKKSDIRQINNVILSDIMYVVDRFGPDRVIIENSPYRGEAGNTLRMWVDPVLI